MLYQHCSRRGGTMSGPARRRVPEIYALVTAAVIPSGACSRLDLCERAWPRDYELNRDVTGEQAVAGPGSLGALPGGGTLLIFRSDAAYGLNQQHRVLKGVLMDSAGAPLRTCGQPNE